MWTSSFGHFQWFNCFTRHLWPKRMKVLPICHLLCGPILPRVSRNSKGVLGTYSTRGLQEQQGGAGDLSYPGSPGTEGAGDLFYPGSPGTEGAGDLFYPGSPGTEGAGDLFYPGSPGTEGAGDLFYPGSPGTEGAGDLFYPGSPGTEGALHLFHPKQQGGAIWTYIMRKHNLATIG